MSVKKQGNLSEVIKRFLVDNGVKAIFCAVIKIDNEEHLQIRVRNENGGRDIVTFFLADGKEGFTVQNAAYILRFMKEKQYLQNNGEGHVRFEDIKEETK